MKKIVSLVLILCMLASSCLMLASCSGTSERDVKKDPAGTISDAVNNAMSDFMEDEAGAGKVLEKALKKGSVGITLSSESLMGGKLTEINEVIYTDQKKNAFVSDTKLIYDGHKYQATLWGDKEGVTFKSASFLGTDDALRLDFNTFIKQFPESALFDYLYDTIGLSDEDATRIVDMVKNVRDLIDEEKAALSDKETDKLIKDIVAIFEQTVDTQKIENEEGKKNDTIVVSYKVDNDKLIKAIQLLADTAVKEGLIVTDDTPEEFREDLDEQLKDFDSAMDISAEILVYIDAKSGTLKTIEFSANVKQFFDLEETAASTLKIEGALTFAANEIALKVEIRGGEEKHTLNAAIEKKKSGNKVTYETHVTVKQGNVQLELLEATCTYNTKSGALHLGGTVAVGSEDSIEFELDATYTVSKNEIVFELDTVEITGEADFTFGKDEDDQFRVVIKVLDEIPTPDTDAVDIVKMDAKEWEDLFESIAKSDISKMFSEILYGIM